MALNANRLPIGKLPSDLLGELLAKLDTDDPRIVLGPGVGLDAAVLDLGDRYLVAATDPITFTTDMLGWYAVHINANDVACMGAAPRWFLGNLLVPEEQAEEDLVRTVFNQIEQACEELDARLIGGHTEITFGISRPILVGTMLGELEPEKLISPKLTEAGDAVLLVGEIPLEATAILARERRPELEVAFSAEMLDHSAELLFSPGISVVAATMTIAEIPGVHGMHDPTEGGLAGGLWELAEAAGCQISVDLSRVPILEHGRQLCEHFDLDPLASIASGSLLVTSEPKQAGQILTALEAANLPAIQIGQVYALGRPSVGIGTPDAPELLPRPARDEIAKLFESQ